MSNPGTTRSAHPGISLWRDTYDRNHWVIALFRRWYFHIYVGTDPTGCPRSKHFYWLRRDLFDLGLAGPWPEFRRVLP